MSVLGLEENLQMVYRSDLGQMHDKGFQSRKKHIENNNSMIL